MQTDRQISGKEAVRCYMQKRLGAKTPPPDADEIRRQLGVQLLPNNQRDERTTGAEMGAAEFNVVGAANVVTASPTTVFAPQSTARTEPCPEEARDAEIGNQTTKIFIATIEKIRAGDATVLHDLGNALGERLCDNETMASLIRATTSGDLLAGSKMLRSLIYECIGADAEIDAIKEVERIEAARVESGIELRIGRAEHDRAMA